MAIFTAIAGGITSVLAAVGTAIGSTAIATTVVSGGQVLGAFVSLGATAASSFFKPKQKSLATADGGSASPTYKATLNETIGPRERAYGVNRTTAIRAFWESRYGSLYQIVMFHQGQIQGFSKFYIGDREVTLSGENVEQAPFAGYVRMIWTLGTAAQTAWADLAALFPDAWSTDHRLRGIAYLGIIMNSPEPERINEVFPQGASTEFSALYLGCNQIYDPRFPSAPVAYSRNNSLCIMDHLIHPDGYGHRVTSSDVDGDSFGAFANVCDEPIALAAGGTEPRYCLDGAYKLTDEPADVQARMLATCDARFYLTPAGKIGIRGGKWVDPTVTIESRDILSFEFGPASDGFSAFNRLRTFYTSPAHEYTRQEGPAWDNEDDQAERGILTEDLSLDMVHSPTQATRLAKIEMARRNAQWSGTITTNLSGLLAWDQSVITVIIPELSINGPFEIQSVSLGEDLASVEFSVVSVSSAAWSWTTAEEIGPIPPPVDTAPDIEIPVPDNLLPVVERRQITAYAVAPVVVATVDAVTARPDLQPEMQIRLSPSGDWEAMPVASGGLTGVSGPVSDGSSYDVRARHRNAGGASAWSATETVAVVANPTAPGTPASFTATGATEATLQWTNPATNFTRSRVFRGTTNVFASATAVTFVSGLAGQISTYVDDPGTGTFYWWIVALNESNIQSTTPAGSQTLTLI